MGRLDELKKLKNDIENAYQKKRNKLSVMYSKMMNEFRQMEDKIYKNYTNDVTLIIQEITKENVSNTTSNDRINMNESNPPKCSNNDNKSNNNDNNDENNNNNNELNQLRAQLKAKMYQYQRMTIQYQQMQSIIQNRDEFRLKLLQQRVEAYLQHPRYRSVDPETIKNSVHLDPSFNRFVNNELGRQHIILKKLTNDIKQLQSVIQRMKQKIAQLLTGQSNNKTNTQVRYIHILLLLGTFKYMDIHKHRKLLTWKENYKYYNPKL